MTVTDGETSDPNRIALDERLIALNDRRYGQPFQLNITEDSATDRKATDCLRDNRALKITFLRTVRMPDDDKLHSLPAALGTFPLYNVAAYADALPPKIVNEGGVFLPMWQREALWIGFESNVVDRYAIRVSIGRVNAISGQNMDTESNIDWFGNITQDYVIVPGQDWLDGICVGPGIVRQFIAMPCKLHSNISRSCIYVLKQTSQWVPLIPSRDRRRVKRSTGVCSSRSSQVSENGSEAGSQVTSCP